MSEPPTRETPQQLILEFPDPLAERDPVPPDQVVSVPAGKKARTPPRQLVRFLWEAVQFLWGAVAVLALFTAVIVTVAYFTGQMTTGYTMTIEGILYVCGGVMAVGLANALMQFAMERGIAGVEWLLEGCVRFVRRILACLAALVLWLPRKLFGSA